MFPTGSEGQLCPRRGDSGGHSGVGGKAGERRRHTLEPEGLPCLWGVGRQSDSPGDALLLLTVTENSD